MKRDQKGFTIVELLIAVAILSIVIASVCGFILVGSRSYAAGNSDISVQQEAQLALNQMSDVLIDTTRSVNYAGYDAGNPVPVLKDAEFTFTPEGKSLIMYNGVVEIASDGSKTVAEGNGNKHYHFYWSKDDETLYYAEVDVQPTDVDMKAVPFPDPADADPDADPALTEWYVLAQHVTDFSVDLSQVEEKRVVQLALTFLDGTKEYVTSNNVTIRNKVGVNDVELDPLNKKKTLSVTPRDSGVIIEPNEKYHFSVPKVTGENVVDRSVTWSVVSSDNESGETRFTDAANGILKVAPDEKAAKITVKITTNAVDSDGNPASCTFEVDIKRVREIKMSMNDAEGTETNSLGETVYLISPGCEYTITADVLGHKLGELCSVCADDINMDKEVGYEGNPYGNPYPWLIHKAENFDLNNYVDIIESKPDHAVIRVKQDVADDGSFGGTIACMSILSTQNKDNEEDGRKYHSWVPGAISVKIVKRKEQAISYGKGLKYGEQTLDKKVTDELPTDHNEYVTAIRVVDNSKVNPQPDRILLHYTIGHGADYRISPDLFDLDLNGSYTFYIQALFPIPEDSYTPGEGGTADDKETIKNEYFNNIKNNTAAQGYTGTRYRHSKVYYANLDKPKVTFRYNGVDYTGENIIYDPVNIYMVGKGTGIIGKVEPVRYDNIESNNGLEGMVYSLYKDDKKWYYYDDSVMDYTGDPKLGGDVVEANPKGDPFLKLDGDNKLEACGDYRIVPGVLYRNKLFDHYDIIGYQGFEPNAERKTRYYKFDESTIYVNVNAEFTMDINDDWFRGQVNFPLPKDILKNPTLFPMPNDTEWKNTSGPLRVEALQTGSSSGEYKTFAYAGYRYIPMKDTWEVEPFEVRFDTNAKKIYTHSYGTYLCNRNGSKWEKNYTTAGSTTEKELMCNVKPFSINDGNDYQAFFPLPTDAGFPFASGAGEIASYELGYFDNNMQSKGTLSGLIVTCKRNGDAYEIEFLKEEGAPDWEPNNHKITVVSYGTYTCRKGQTEWTRKKGYGTSYKTDFVPTLRDLKLPDGNTYMMDYPLPGSGFPFTNSGDSIRCDDEKAYDQINDAYAANVKTPFKDYVNQGIEAEYTIDSGDTHTIRFYKKEQIGKHGWRTTTYGVYTWRSGQTEWTKGEGYSVTDTTDLVTNLEGLTIDGTSYKMYFPKPGDSDFPFKDGKTEIECSQSDANAYVAYKVTDIYGDDPMMLAWRNANVEYTYSESTHRITFFDRWNKSQVYGTFRWNAGESKWEKVN